MIHQFRIPQSNGENPGISSTTRGTIKESPAFRIWSGTGKFWMVSIAEYIDDKSLKPSQRDREIWRVDADSQASAAYPSSIEKISYGIVPRGYHQSVPASRAPPPWSLENTIHTSLRQKTECLRAWILKFEMPTLSLRRSNALVPTLTGTVTKSKFLAMTPILIVDRGITLRATEPRESVSDDVVLFVDCSLLFRFYRLGFSCLE